MEMGPVGWKEGRCRQIEEQPRMRDGEMGKRMERGGERFWGGADDGAGEWGREGERDT